MEDEGKIITDSEKVYIRTKNVELHTRTSWERVPAIKISVG